MYAVEYVNFHSIKRFKSHFLPQNFVLGKVSATFISADPDPDPDPDDLKCWIRTKSSGSDRPLYKLFSYGVLRAPLVVSFAKGMRYGRRGGRNCNSQSVRNSYISGAACFIHT
jgi:hypothetical protein